jgi:hypothetical protein
LQEAFFALLGYLLNHTGGNRSTITTTSAEVEPPEFKNDQAFLDAGDSTSVLWQQNPPLPENSAAYFPNKMSLK